MYGYSIPVSSSSSSMGFAGVWMIISIILAIAGGILVYCLFMSKKNEKKFKGFTAWLYEFLHFRILTLEVLLKVLYLITAIFITLSSFTMITSNVLVFLAYLVGGNFLARISYEMISLMVIIARNSNKLNDIEKKLDK